MKQQKYNGKDIYLAHVPETIIFGNIVNEFITNKVSIGGIAHNCKFILQTANCEIVYLEIITAEFVKAIEIHIDVNIASSNELIHLSDEMGIVVYKAINIANKYPRVNLHTPSIGV